RCPAGSWGEEGSTGSWGGRNSAGCWEKGGSAGSWKGKTQLAAGEKETQLEIEKNRAGLDDVVKRGEQRTSKTGSDPPLLFTQPPCLILIALPAPVPPSLRSFHAQRRWLSPRSGPPSSPARPTPPPFPPGLPLWLSLDASSSLPPEAARS